MTFSNKTYDILKWVTTIVLPAIATAYFGLASIWGFPNGEAVVGTIAVITTLFGAVLGISNSKYKKANIGTDGAVIIGDGDDIAGNAYIQFDNNPKDIFDKDQIVLNIVRTTEEQ